MTDFFSDSKAEILGAVKTAIGDGLRKTNGAIRADIKEIGQQQKRMHDDIILIKADQVNFVRKLDAEKENNKLKTKINRVYQFVGGVVACVSFTGLIIGILSRFGVFK